MIIYDTQVLCQVLYFSSYRRNNKLYLLDKTPLLFFVNSLIPGFVYCHSSKMLLSILKWSPVYQIYCSTVKPHLSWPSNSICDSWSHPLLWNTFFTSLRFQAFIFSWLFCSHLTESPHFLNYKILRWCRCQFSALLCFSFYIHSLSYFIFL